MSCVSVQASHLSLSTHWLNILYYCIYPPLDLFKWDIYDGYGIMFTAFIIVIFRWNHPHVFPKACEEQRSISHNRWIFHYTIHEVRSCSLWYTVHQCRAAFLRISFHTFAVVSLPCWIENKQKKQNRTPFIHHILFNNINFALQSTISIRYIWQNIF